MLLHSEICSEKNDTIYLFYAVKISLTGKKAFKLIWQILPNTKMQKTQHILFALCKVMEWHLHPSGTSKGIILGSPAPKTSMNKNQ